MSRTFSCALGSMDRAHQQSSRGRPFVPSNFSSSVRVPPQAAGMYRSCHFLHSHITSATAPTVSKRPDILTMYQYRIQIDDTSEFAQTAEASQTLPSEAFPGTNDYLHPPNDGFADYLSDHSSALSNSSITRSEDAQDTSAKERKRLHRVQKVRETRQRQNEAREQARQELERYREQQSGWEELQSYTETWLGAAHWLFRQHEPVTLYLNTDSSTSETTRSPADILVQTLDNTHTKLLSDLVQQLMMTSNDLLQAWMPSEWHEAEISPDKPKAKTGRPRLNGEGLNEAQRRQRGYRIAHGTKKAAEGAKIHQALAAFRSRLPTTRACEQFVQVWQESIESIFNDFHSGRQALTVQATCDAGKSSLPVPSGITVEISGVSSRQLSHSWAGEWLGSPVELQIQTIASAVPELQYPSGAGVENNGSGSSLTANSLAALQAELCFQRMMQDTPLDPNYTSE